MSPGEQFLTAFKIIVQTQSDSFGEVILWRGALSTFFCHKRSGPWGEKKTPTNGGRETADL